MPPPMATIHQLTRMPTRAHATPSASPIGQTLRLGVCSGSTLFARLSLACPPDSILPHAGCQRGDNRIERQTILGPPGVDEHLYVGRHLDLRRPRPCSLG